MEDTHKPSRDYKQEFCLPTTDGKKRYIYDREFLLHLQYQPHSTIEPSGLPNIEVVLSNKWQKDQLEINSIDEDESDMNAINSRKIEPQQYRDGGSRFRGRPRQYDQSGARPKTLDRGGGQGGRFTGNQHSRPTREEDDHTFLQNLRDQQDPQGIAENMIGRTNIENLLNLSNIEQSDQIVLIEVLSKACQFSNSNSSVFLNRLISLLIDPGTQFMQQLPPFLLNLRHFGQIPNSIVCNVLLNTIDVLSSILNHAPGSSYLKICVVVTMLEKTISELQSLNWPTNDNNPELIINSFQNLKELLEIVKKEMEVDKGSSHFGREKKEPPNNFRHMSIYPTKEELDPDFSPFLRKNIVEGYYDDGDHYLDVQFRLLREDFIRPLRSGITEYKKEKAKGQPGRLRLTDINIYDDVKYYNYDFNHSGVSYKIQFDIEPFHHVCWESSQRLIGGSLVCLTNDEFSNHFIFATITEQNVEDLKRGLINITIVNKFEKLETNTVYLMVESGAYFESYRHVLKGLQEIKGEEVPFEEHVVQAETEVKPPEYLNAASVYNFSCIQNQTETTKNTCVRVLKDNEWPSANDLSLDEPQFRALKQALTKRLAIIQGPPGTGKTYISLKIVKMLLENSHIWQHNSIDIDKRPILIVCYTNHALDQFLEGIIEQNGGEFEGLVRIGSRSDCESLKSNNLKELRKELKEIYLKFKMGGLFLHESEKDGFLGQITQSFHYFRLLRDRGRENYQLNLIKNSVIFSEALIEATNSNIIPKIKLQKYILELHSQQLDTMLHELNYLRQREKKTFKRESDILLIWLGVKWSELPNLSRHNEGIPLEEIREINISVINNNGEYSDNEEDDDEDEALSIKEKNKRKKNHQIKMLTLDIEDHPKKADGDGDWTLVGNKKKFDKNYMWRELNKFDIMTEDEVNLIKDVWDISQQNRWRLYRYWTTQMRNQEKRKIEEYKKIYTIIAAKIQSINDELDVIVLNKAVVIGMTTSGAAKYRRIIQRVRPKIVIIEEAAEVFEAHVIVSLSKYCQHLILIGDHQQLRPNPTVYQLAKKFYLDISLFERLLNNGIQFNQLVQQHRMRPEISELLIPIYPNLKNHSSVLKYENIKGVSKNIFFLDHEKIESSINDMKSHANVFETKYITSLCLYLLNQDYIPSQITVLTTYSGQYQELKKLMAKNSKFEDVRISIVDNFQGEENDIIILSLVRSNDTDSIGFLSISNRVCVALSRAKKGFYCIGNMQMLARKSELWSSIVDKMKERNQIGQSLELACQNHPKTILQAVSAKDFNKAPEGGCLLPCDFRLNCGHVCSLICHPYDPMHKQYKCPKPISVVLPCGHKANMSCYKYSDNSNIYCIKPCKEIFDCGHQCTNICGYESDQHNQHNQCLIKVDSDWPCGHAMKVECHQKGDFTLCDAKCNATLSCGHTCLGTCGECQMGRLHVPCRTSCTRSLVCGHLCGGHPCGTSCPPCKNPCENQCEHSKCKKECGLPCTPCPRVCQNKCSHSKCSQVCGGVCDKPECNQPCRHFMWCGHQCIGVCGEICPIICCICDKKELLGEVFFGTEDVDESLFIQLADCGHVFDVNGLDHWMNMASEPEEGPTNIKMKTCPRCKTPIRQSRRYRDIVNKVLNDIEKVKNKIFGNQQILKMKRIHAYLNLFLTMKQRRYLKGSETVSYKEMVFLENKIEILSKLHHLGQGKNQSSVLVISGRLLPFMPSCTCGGCDVCDLGKILEKNVKEFKNGLSPLDDASKQQMEDLLAKLDWILLMSQLVQMFNKIKGIDDCEKYDQVLVDLKYAQSILSTAKPLSLEDNIIIKKKLEKIRKMGVFGLDKIEEEKVLIVKAMGFAKDIWYKCPEGHVYAMVGGCGEANLESACPDCRKMIGGSDHSLASDYQHVAEIDDFELAFWSEEASNKFNYE